MNDNKQKAIRATPTKTKSGSWLSRASSTLGIIGTFLFFIPLIVRIFCDGTLRALDFCQMAAITAFGWLFGLGSFVMGIILCIVKGRNRLAIRGLVTGGLVVVYPILVLVLIPFGIPAVMISMVLPFIVILLSFV